VGTFKLVLFVTEGRFSSMIDEDFLVLFKT
jgi:hypothetical protein